MNQLFAEAPTLEQLIASHLPSASRGDRDAYGRIVGACQNTVTAIALAITRDVAASEDIAQDAFISAWQQLKRLQNPSSFLPWLRQITRNLSRDHLRERMRRGREVADADEVIAAVADPHPSPFEQLMDDEHHHVAAELISALPEDSREVLLLYYREGQNSRQVAMLLGLSDAAVRKRLSRARQSVRDDLLKRFGEFARDSAPSMAFTAVVATALTIGAPPVAAAGLLSVGAAAGAKTVGQLLLGAAGTMGLAVVAGSAGIFLGLRKQLRGAIDQFERRALIRSAMVSTLASIAFVLAMLLLARTDSGWLLPLLATVAFVMVVFHQSLVVQPRAMARRHALEARHDPLAAAARRRRERVLCWIGGTIGLVCAVGGVLAGLVSSGRL